MLWGASAHAGLSPSLGRRIQGSVTKGKSAAPQRDAAPGPPVPLYPFRNSPDFTVREQEGRSNPYAMVSPGVLMEIPHYSQVYNQLYRNHAGVGRGHGTEYKKQVKRRKKRAKGEAKLCYSTGGSRAGGWDGQRRGVPATCRHQASTRSRSDVSDCHLHSTSSAHPGTEKREGEQRAGNVWNGRALPACYSEGGEFIAGTLRLLPAGRFPPSIGGSGSGCACCTLAANE